jgi:hypothetical protein
MSILSSQLAIFGAIDELVLAARQGKTSADNAVLVTAAKLLPNATGFGEAGWYRELEQFVNREGIRLSHGILPIRFPTLGEATAELKEVPPPTFPSVERPTEITSTKAESSEPSRFPTSGEATAPADTTESADTADTAALADTTALGEATAELREVQPPPAPSAELPSEPVEQTRDLSAPGGFEKQTRYDSAYDPVLARAGYGAFVLLKLSQIANPDISTDPLYAELQSVLAVAVRSFLPGSDDAELLNKVVDAILGQIAAVNTRREWIELAKKEVNPQFAQNSTPCFGTLEEINGKYCSTVVTDSEADDLSVKDIEKIIDPINWSLCSKFFCHMEMNIHNRNAAGWSRVQEQIGAECSEYRLITDLIFYKVRQADGSIFMNYDIDPQRDIDPQHGGKDQGYVEVDNGYIFVSPSSKNVAKDPTKPGVRIQTSKQEHVDGLSPSATAALACLMGWADAGKEMLAGTARKILQATQAGAHPPPLKVFYPSDEFDPGEQQ